MGSSAASSEVALRNNFTGRGTRFRAAPLAVATFVAMLANSMLVPALPGIAAGLGVTVAQAGALVTAYVLAYGLLTPALGILADRVGRRAVLVPCLVAFGIGGAVPIVTTDFALVVAGRVLQGAGGAGILPVALAWVADSAVESRDRATGALSVAFAAGESFAPVVGGVLALASWRAPFAAYLAALPVALLVAVAVPDSRPSRRSTFASYARGAGRVLRSPALLALYATFFLFAFAYFGLVTLFPAHAALKWGAGPGKSGLLLLAFGVGWTLSSAAFSRLDRVPRGFLLAGGLVAQAGALGGLLATHSASVAVPLLAAWGAGAGAVVTALFALVPSRTEEEHRGVVSSLLSSTGFLGLGAGPVALPLVASASFDAAAPIAIGAIAVATGLASAVALADARALLKGAKAARRARRA